MSTLGAVGQEKKSIGALKLAVMGQIPTLYKHDELKSISTELELMLFRLDDL